MAESRIEQMRQLLESAIGKERAAEALDVPLSMELSVEEWALMLSLLDVAKGIGGPKGVELARLHGRINAEFQRVAEQRGRQIAEAHPEIRKSQTAWSVLDIMDQINVLRKKGTGNGPEK